MDDKRQKTQVGLALVGESTGEAQRLAGRGTESATAEHGIESLAEGGHGGAWNRKPGGRIHLPLNLPNRRVRTRTLSVSTIFDGLLITLFDGHGEAA